MFFSSLTLMRPVSRALKRQQHGTFIEKHMFY
ncbi:hypothetical protein Asd1617_01851 [Shigella dysenteriae 1617]|uniref:Uncharacterized protein n=1 Tax=Shigella dysenteriae 1617 TaxID=754093 RepID=A0A0A6ZRI4_SHIDY|nr:hypothetical protein Asd1617_01851 [Shigella dysenteriae 1617]